MAVLLLLAGRPGLGQPAPFPASPHLTRAQALADLQLLRQLRERAHAGTYKYRTRAQLDSAYAAASRQVGEGLSVLQLYRLVVGLTDLEGSLHNDTELPAKLQQAGEQQPAYFPYLVRLVAGRLRLDDRQGPWPVGTELLTINGQALPELQATLGRYYTTDGTNTTGRYPALGEHFARFYHAAYGPQDTFRVAVRLPGHSAPVVRALPAVPYAAVVARRRQRHSRLLDSLQQPAASRPYGLQLRGAAAVLTIRSFDIGDNARSGAHRAYALFLDSCFTLIRDRPAIAAVLVDIRGNGGGSDPNDLLTFSYLARQPFRENTSAFVRCRRLPARAHQLTESRGLARWVEQLAETWALHREFGPADTAGRHYQRARWNPVWPPNALHTTKPLYLLVDQEVASAASLFAALVRGNTEAVVIGTETIGGYYGHTGHTPVAYQLPHSGIITRFSLVDLEQQVLRRATQPVGRGILPDIEVVQSYEDYLQHQDTQLQTALRLLEAQAASRHAR
ncbi:hypothetical protein KLP40_03870 [Hymenobacter sp. NST-14]|uniref:S41 family peptidase n=1 Tax=Hymenobacter piscis TaxID=2839984 RepID=UPI001C036C4F|nr:S41 family peptidase [Hymenobacter piscis]MBT9392291.1 hypothetical protein [Hymenobacter piscis]